MALTYGEYEDQRSDNNFQSAVNGFCSEVEKQVAKLGLFEGDFNGKLRALCEKFEALNWIANLNNRIEKKRKVAQEIKALCRNHTFNKHLLLAEHRADYIPFFGAVICLPEPVDCRLFLQIEHKHLGQGFAYHWLLDAMDTVKAMESCTSDQLLALREWLKKLPNPNAEIEKRIAGF